MRVCLAKPARQLKLGASALLVVFAAATPSAAAERESAALVTATAPAHQPAQATPPQVFVEVIVKACPQVETPLEPTNHGHRYDDDKPMTHQERMTYYADLGCIDVPIPPEWMTQQLSYEGCKGHAGYLASLQFLQQRQDLKKFPAVGYWACIPHAYPVSGVTGM